MKIRVAIKKKKLGLWKSGIMAIEANNIFDLKRTIDNILADETIKVSTGIIVGGQELFLGEWLILNHMDFKNLKVKVVFDNDKLILEDEKGIKYPQLPLAICEKFGRIE